MTSKNTCQCLSMSSLFDIKMTAQQVEEVRALSKQCGLDSKGSKMDMILRLREKMNNRVTYSKVFEKVEACSSGQIQRQTCF